MIDNNRFRPSLLPVLAMIVTGLPISSLAQSSDIDPEAIDLLRHSTEYVAGAKQFSLEADSSIEIVLATGQKLQLGTRMTVTMQRPNKMHAQRVGEIVDQAFYYDGKTLVSYAPENKVYASISAPPTLDEMLEFARFDLDVIAPAADLVMEDSFKLLTEGLTSAFVVGDAMIEGVRCDHLAFRNAEVDWQVWIQQGDKPVPMKYVVTSKRMLQSPQYVVVLSKWDTTSEVDDKLFEFEPPEGTTKVDFITGKTLNDVQN